MDTPYEKCSLHPQELLQMVCMDCDVNALACPSCIDHSHNHHTIISLKKFLSQELTKLFSRPPDPKHLTQHIRQLGNSYQQCFQIMRKLIGQEINDLEAAYALEVEVLLGECELVCGRSKFTVEGISAVKQKIKAGDRIPDPKAFATKTAQLCSKMEQLISENTQEVCLTIRRLRGFWEESKQLLLNSKRINQFAFSSQFKHKSISIEVNSSQSKKAINLHYDNSYHMAVVQPALSPFRNEIKFRVDKSEGNCAWIGICNLKAAMDRKFTNCYKQGDQAYWLWQAGCEGGAQVFSNVLPESYTLPWNFEVGQVVTIRLTYDKGVRYVQFDKNKAKCYKVKLEEGTFHACIATGAEEETVSIVNPVF